MCKLTENIEITRSTLLYILEKLGGEADFHKIFKILFFADKKHLARFGSTITNDTYMAMAYGPVPSMAYDVLKSLRGEGLMTDKKDYFEPYFKLKNSYIVKALRKPDMDDISESEKSVIDEVINEYGNLDFDQRTTVSHGNAWKNAKDGGDISIIDMAKEENASEEMIEYIETVNENSKAVFI